MARVIKHYCDFCDKEIELEKASPRTVYVGTDGDMGTKGPSAEINLPELCKDCHVEALKTLVSFAGHINTKGGRLTLKEEEAAHE